jgi:hypothetical protein
LSTASFFIDSFQIVEGSFTLGVINEHPQEVRFEEMPGRGSWEECQRAAPNLVEPVLRPVGPAFDARTFEERQEARATAQGIRGDGRAIVHSHGLIEPGEESSGSGPVTAEAVWGNAFEANRFGRGGCRIGASVSPSQ